MTLNKLHDVFEWTENGNRVFKSDLAHIPDVLVHMTPFKNVASILSNGLTPNLKGVYLADAISTLEMDCMDDFNTVHMAVLKIDVRTFKNSLIPDPEWRSSDNNNPMHCVDDLCWYVIGNIDPQFIKVQ